MPQSRKRPGHHEHHQPSPVPSAQRTKGRMIVAILFSLFGLAIAFFAAGANIPVLILGLLAGGGIGYMVGRNMEQDARKA
jgi:hypothetical protein